MGANDISFDMTADPSEFAEAIAEFSARRVISREEADRLSGDARRRSWWISGVAQMDVANDAHQSIIEALRKGVPFEEWQKTAGAAIERDWGRKDSARLLLIFRNATSQAYNSGRWEQMGEPHIVAARPYKKLSVVNDLRTSEICQEFISPAVILPANDPWWLTHCPPLHHGCRSGIITLRLGPAKEQGILKSAPTEQADEGFGLAPAYQEPPKPSERKVPPEPEIAVKMAEKASRDYRTRKPVEIKISPKHTPEYWEDHYREKYGEAARQVGYGRAIHERAKAMPLKEASAILEKLRSSGVPGIGRKMLLELDNAIRLEQKGQKVTGYLEAVADTSRLLAEHFRLVGRSDVPLLKHEPEVADDVTRNANFWRAFSSPRLPLPPGTKFRWLFDEDRSYYDVGWDEVSLARAKNEGTAVHEYGHAVEHHVNLAGIARKFVAARTVGEPLVQLKTLFPSLAYGPDEVTKKDKFFEAYMGRDYGPESSEVISVLVGEMAKGRTAEILDRDPESLYFILGILSGVLP